MKDNTKKTLSIYIKTAWKYKFSVISAYLATIVITLIPIIQPLYFKDLIDVLGSGGDHASIVSELVYIIIIIVFLDVLAWIFWRIVNFCSMFSQSKIMEDLSNMCFRYLHKCSYNYFTDNFGGALVKKVKWFSTAYEDLSDNLLYNLVPTAITITAIVCVLFRINILFGFGLFVWVFLFLGINFLFVRYKFRYELKKAKTETELTGLLSDTITNHNNVKLFNGYAREVKRYASKTKAFQKIWLFSNSFGEMFFAVQAILFIALEAGMFFYAVHLWDRGLFTAGGFMLIQLYVIRTISMIWSIGKNIQRFYSKLADAEEMTILLNTPHDIKDIPRAKKLTVSNGEIEFKNVRFNYNETRSILENFNLTIKPKESVALIGSSGAGKTTVVKLLFRMHDVTGGAVLIDGQNIAKVTQESLWQNVSLVPQDPMLFHRSLMENIRYGKPKASDKDVVVAAKLACCHDFIMESPYGYDTFVGERGIKLSGGERQRVAIARAILKNAPILILDEATSSLDSESEHLIQEALSELIKNKTVIVIAHRLSTIRKVDRIIVVEDGKIIEEGDHSSLIDKKSGIYSKLWEIQAGGFVR